MRRIAVVDDERVFSDAMEKSLRMYAERNAREFEIVSFSGGDKFLTADKAELFDVVFLDIDMPGDDGMSVAKELRGSGRNIIIIFCTNLAQYAIDGYSVDAFGYLLKPVTEQSIFDIMDRACMLMDRMQCERLYIKTVHGQELVQVKDLIYVEVQRHNLYFYVSDKNGKLSAVRTRGAIQDISKDLESSSFVRCSVCYLVNLRQVLSIENNTVRLPGIELPISRTYKKKFTDAFMRYLIAHGVPNIYERR